jgi:hypothetical protein
VQRGCGIKPSAARRDAATPWESTEALALALLLQESFRRSTHA